MSQSAIMALVETDSAEIDERGLVDPRRMGATAQLVRAQGLSDSEVDEITELFYACLLYTSPSPRDKRQSRMPSSA